MAARTKSRSNLLLGRHVVLREGWAKAVEANNLIALAEAKGTNKRMAPEPLLHMTLRTLDGNLPHCEVVEVRRSESICLLQVVTPWGDIVDGVMIDSVIVVREDR